MGLINLEPTLRDGEDVRWRAARRIPYDDLVGATVLEREPSLTTLVRRDGAALQRRLRIETRHDDTLLLVVRHPDEVAAALAGAADSPD